MPSCAILLIWLVLFDYGRPYQPVFDGHRRGPGLLAGRLAMRVPVILLFVWKNLGLAIVIFLAAMQSVPEPYYEYARLEGAGFFRQALVCHPAHDRAQRLSGVHPLLDQFL